MELHETDSRDQVSEDDDIIDVEEASWDIVVRTNTNQDGLYFLYLFIFAFYWHSGCYGN